MCLKIIYLFPLPLSPLSTVFLLLKKLKRLRVSDDCRSHTLFLTWKLCLGKYFGTTANGLKGAAESRSRKALAATFPGGAWGCAGVGGRREGMQGHERTVRAQRPAPARSLTWETHWRSSSLRGFPPKTGWEGPPYLLWELEGIHLFWFIGSCAEVVFVMV